MCVCGSHVISRLFSLTSVFKNSTCFLRLLLNLRRVSQVASIVHMPPRDESLVDHSAFAYHDELAVDLYMHVNRFRAISENNVVPTVLVDGEPDVDSESDDEGRLRTSLGAAREKRSAPVVVHASRSEARSNKFKQELAGD